MQKKPSLIPTACLALGLSYTAQATETSSAEERQISYMKAEAGHITKKQSQARLFGSKSSISSTTISGTLTIGKVITYDVINHTDYNEEPEDLSTFNMVMAGYSPTGPNIGSLSANLTGIKSLAFARVIKMFSTAPIPEADLACNFLMTTSDDIQGLSIDGTYLPLTKVGSSTKSGTTYYDYAAVSWDGDSSSGFHQYFLDQNAFCATFESFNSSYPNGSTVPITLTP